MPVTAFGKLFASLLASFSDGTVIVALIFLFGPFFGRLHRTGLDRHEGEAEREVEKVEGRCYAGLARRLLR